MKTGNTGVPILRVYMSLLLQHCVRLCITTTPVITFLALNNFIIQCVVLWGDDIQRTPVVTWVIFGI